MVLLPGIVPNSASTKREMVLLVIMIVIRNRGWETFLHFEREYPIYRGLKISNIFEAPYLYYYYHPNPITTNIT